MKKIIMYGIKNCDSVRKAMKWLNEYNIKYQFHDLRSDGLSRARLEKWVLSTDYESVLNKKSTTWRKLSKETQKKNSSSEAIKLMLAQPTLIKRPILDVNGFIYIGFTAEQYDIIFSSKT